MSVYIRAETAQKLWEIDDGNGQPLCARLEEMSAASMNYYMCGGLHRQLPGTLGEALAQLMEPLRLLRLLATKADKLTMRLPPQQMAYVLEKILDEILEQPKPDQALLANITTDSSSSLAVMGQLSTGVVSVHAMVQQLAQKHMLWDAVKMLKQQGIKTPTLDLLHPPKFGNGYTPYNHTLANLLDEANLPEIFGERTPHPRVVKSLPRVFSDLPDNDGIDTVLRGLNLEYIHKKLESLACLLETLAADPKTVLKNAQDAFAAQSGNSEKARISAQRIDMGNVCSDIDISDAETLAAQLRSAVSVVESAMSPSQQPGKFGHRLLAAGPGESLAR